MNTISRNQPLTMGKSHQLKRKSHLYLLDAKCSPITGLTALMSSFSKCLVEKKQQQKVPPDKVVDALTLRCLCPLNCI